ncbi:MAG: DM13 domain-containing protein [Actinomycetota bacterium]
MWLPGVVRRHPRTALIVVLVGIGLMVFGVLWFEPHKLFIEERVDEARPGEPASAAVAGDDGDDEGQPEPDEAEGEPEPSGPEVLVRGRFISLEHQSSGRAVVLRLAGGKRFLRFESFSTSNGPDLRVYLSAKPASEDWRGYDREFVDLGELKGNIGDQNYEIPADVDLDRYRSAVVWCRRFTVGFAVAPLR